MSLTEVQTQAASLGAEERRQFAAFLTMLHMKETGEWSLAATGNAALAESKAPDFLARQKAIFGERMLPDSQAVLDELRAERF